MHHLCTTYLNVLAGLYGGFVSQGATPKSSKLDLSIETHGDDWGSPMTLKTLTTDLPRALPRS